MSKILFADILRPKLNIPKTEGGGTYWNELERLVHRHGECSTACADWVIRLSTQKIRQELQYDKCEPPITYYLWAALWLATDEFRATNPLRALFSKRMESRATSDQVLELLTGQGWPGLHFEALLCPTDAQRAKVKQSIDELPVPYLREIGVKKPGVRFESPTHLDVFVGDDKALVNGGGRAALGVESKFTSDIDDHTTYSPHRNQIIRNIEVGNARFSEFIFFLITPRIYRQRRSRFYVYKMEEYLGVNGVAALRRDSLVDPSDEQAAGWRNRIAWFDWEDIVDVIFPSGQSALKHSDAETFADFLRGRRLLGRPA